MTSTISVIIPVYNRMELLERSLASVVAQTFADFEVIIVDDGSSEHLGKVVSAAQVDRLKVLRHSQNRGAAAARNTGVDAAEGRWVAFLDSDDTWAPDKLAKQIAYLDATPVNPVKACATGFHLHKRGAVRTYLSDIGLGEFQTQIRFGCSICPGSTLIVDRQAFYDVGPFDEALRRLEDWDWLLRYADRYDVAFLREPLADIYLDQPLHPLPESDDRVIHAIGYIDSKHNERYRSISHRAHAQFRSTLHVERAAYFYRRRQPLNAAWDVIVALAIYPRRNMVFFSSLWHAFTSLLRPRGQ